MHENSQILGILHANTLKSPESPAKMSLPRPNACINSMSIDHLRSKGITYDANKLPGVYRKKKGIINWKLEMSIVSKGQFVRSKSNFN
jgi:hypothetical protein